MQATTNHERPFTAYGLLMVLLVLCASAAMSAQAQNHFPAPIPFGSLTFGLQEVATVPDSTPGRPPRLSVLTSDPSGRLFVNDQRGPLYLLAAGDGGALSATRYLDLRDFPQVSVISTSEAGFQSFAFHPQFSTVGAAGFGRFYTVSSSTNTAQAPDFTPGGGTSFHTLVLEWRTADPNATTFVAMNSAAPFREVLRFSQPFGNHNAGLVAFNPNVPSTAANPGLLYLALGDGGSGGDPQENGEDPSNPYGAILRIDPLGTNAANGRYGIVPENALAADGLNTTLGEIFAFGLRNPQRFGWDTKTGHLYAADIGQNAVEEINLIANGANFGWDHREGSFPFEGGGSALIDPVAEYDHTSPVSEMPTSIGNRAVTLGEVVRGSSLPGLDGHLLIADFPTGLFFALNVDTSALNGGQSELRQVRLRSQSGQTLPFISFINAARAQRGLGTSSRADLRLGVNTPGRVFLINKHDGIVRELTLDPTLDSDGDSCPDVLDDDPASALQVVGRYIGAQCPLGGGSVHASAGADPDGDGIASCRDVDDDNDGICDGPLAVATGDPSTRDSAGCEAGPDACPTTAGTDALACTTLRTCESNPWWQTCAVDDCAAFMVRLFAGPDTARIDTFSIINETLFLSTTAQISARDLIDILTNRTHPSVRVEIWTRLADGSPGNRVATVADFDPAQLTLGPRNGESLVTLSTQAGQVSADAIASLTDAPCLLSLQAGANTFTHPQPGAELGCYDVLTELAGDIDVLQHFDTSDGRFENCFFHPERTPPTPAGSDFAVRQTTALHAYMTAARTLQIECD